MSDIRIVKFETMVEEINNLIKFVYFTDVEYGRVDVNNGLFMIFDYDKLNEYGKIIMDKSCISFVVDFVKLCDFEAACFRWFNEYDDGNDLKNLKARRDAAEIFGRLCRESYNRAEAYKFIFWALMILTVDKTDAEEHLSLICDFARMLNISDDELEDIVLIIKSLYTGRRRVFFKTANVPKLLGNAWNWNAIK